MEVDDLYGGAYCDFILRMKDPFLNTIFLYCIRKLLKSFIFDYRICKTDFLHREVTEDGKKAIDVVRVRVTNRHSTNLSDSFRPQVRHEDYLAYIERTVTGAPSIDKDVLVKGTPDLGLHRPFPYP